MKRRTYAERFRARVVQQLLAPNGKTASEQARELGLAQSTLSRWRIIEFDEVVLSEWSPKEGAAEGELDDPRQLLERAEILAPLSNLHRVVVRVAIDGTTKEERTLLERSIDQVLAHGLDITLLGPAPQIRGS